MNEYDLSFEEGLRRSVFTVPGDEVGRIGFKPILQALSKAHYRGWLVVEAEQDPRTYHRLTYAMKVRSTCATRRVCESGRSRPVP